MTYLYGESMPRKQSSCLIAPIGDQFLSGCKESLVATAKDLEANDIITKVIGIQNVCVQPFHGLGAMRNQAILNALQNQADYLLIVDNDIRLSDPTAIRALIASSKEIIVPWFDQRALAQPGIWHKIQSPMPAPNQGLIELQWIAVNCILIATSIFRFVDPRLFTDPMITNEEGYIFDYLRFKGVRLWQDTGVFVEMLRPPTRLWEVMLGGRNPNPVPEEYATSGKVTISGLPRMEMP